MDCTTASRGRQGKKGRVKGRSSRTAKAAEIREAIFAYWRTHSDREIAKLLGVSPTTVGQHRKMLESAGEILPSVETGQSGSPCLHEVSIFAIEPSPENDRLYDPYPRGRPGVFGICGGH